jgi:hypothetical protein
LGGQGVVDSSRAAGDATQSAQAHAGFIGADQRVPALDIIVDDRPHAGGAAQFEERREVKQAFALRAVELTRKTCPKRLALGRPRTAPTL